jgi:hypothetical protein
LQGAHNDAHHYSEENNGYERCIDNLKSPYPPDPLYGFELPKG